MKGNLMPSSAMKVILSGLLNSSWGSFHRSTIVRLTVYGNRVEIGIGEGNMYQWEIETLKDTLIEHEWITVGMLRTVCVEGIKYVPEKKIPGMPRGLLPIQSKSIYVFVSDDLEMMFPAYRCFDINFGDQRILSILSPKTIIRDIAETAHPAFPKERYRGRVDSVEVRADALSRFFEEGYGIGILRKGETMEGMVRAFPLLGEKDIKTILESISKAHREATNKDENR